MKNYIPGREMYYGANSETLRVAAMLRKKMTLAENALWKRLKDRKIFKSKFRRQHPIFIFIVDFYCHELKLVIEVDGGIHEDELVREYDLGRTAELDRFGIKVIRFTNEQILYHIDSVLNEIHGEVTKQTPL